MVRIAATLLALVAPFGVSGGLAQEGEMRTAIFAGGCFWCVEADFDKLPGVIETISGYTGGTVDNPTYEQVTYEDTGHYEAVKITYDPSVIDYETLTTAFFQSVDPTDAGGQFCDRGPSYRTAIFVSSPAQREVATIKKAQSEEYLGEDIVTPILDASEFWPAEDYHQNYYQKNSLKYQYYRWGCDRDDTVEGLWGQPAEDSFKELAKGLS